jgi:NADH-quinone oxidoreductase subunit M
LIGIWGGKERIYATLKFVLYTMAGSALMLVAIVALALLSKAESFHILALLRAPEALSPGTQILLFAAFALAFAVKVPLFPLHTWLPDAHVQAPTAGSVMLAGVLLKLGTYGYLRFGLPLFPEAAVAAVPLMMGLAIIGIWYGAWVAFAQTDIKKLVAYSSVSHMGIVVVGLFAFNAQGLAGGTLQMINHGISTGALFLLVGMLYERAHSRNISDFGGLWASMPRFSALFLLVTFSSIGLPGTNGFVGEWLSILGAFRANMLVGVLATFGVVLGAAYMLWLYQRVFFGPTSELSAKMEDISGMDLLVLAPLVILIFWIGIYPDTFLGPIQEATTAWLRLIDAATPVIAGR